MLKSIAKLISVILAALFVLVSLAGCSGSSGKTDPTAAPTAANTQNGDPTEVPEWMWTPDPAQFILGEDGYFEDEVLSAYWPKYLEYNSSSASNNAMYIGYPEGSEKKLVFSYTRDEGGSFEDEIAIFDHDSFLAFLREKGNPFNLLEFGFTTVAGHRAMRAVYTLDPPDEPEHFVRFLQYAIDVNGWILNLCYTTQADTFPEEAITSFNTIRFKDGY